MIKHGLHFAIICLLTTAGYCNALLGQDALPTDSPEQVAARVEYFEAKVRPLLVERCYSCHSVESGTAEGGLLLDSAAAMRRGGSRGNVVTTGPNAEESLLLKAMSHSDAELRMPPDGKLADEELAIIKQWLLDGAHDPRQENPDAAPDKAAVASKHWAYQLPRPTDIAIDPDDRNSRDPIDRIISQRLQLAGVQGNDEADDVTLIRRLYHDLLGLPATSREIQAYLNDPSPQRYEKAVDRLLSTPAFGERMARRWMDVVRYADNKGYVFQEDREYKFAYTYRDWLIEAFNGDMPYNEFVSYQIAADSLDTTPDHRHAPAMGMLTLGRRFLNDQNDIADDRIDVMTRGLMGLTVACARCHDHKYDPIGMADYYSLHSAMINSEQKPADDATSLMLVDKSEIAPAVIFERGNPGRRGAQVDKRFVSFISLQKDYRFEAGSGRREVAAAITDPSNPLTARTMVNRVWGWLYGKPLVATPSDLGLRCDPPVQQDVLDQLAVDFVQQGWSIKGLVRRMVLSSTYRRSSRYCEASAAVDPTNDLWWRAERKRLDFETLRDTMLEVSGQLNRSVGGPSVKIFEPPLPPRRTLYAYIDRQNLAGVFRAFDFANPDTHVPRRSQTTVPQQGLFLLNSDFAMAAAEAVAKRCVATERRAAIAEVFSRVLHRQPQAVEYEAAEAFLVNAEAMPRPVETERWKYGYGIIDREAMRVKSFEQLEVFHKDRYAGAAELPSEKLGFINHSADGTHPGRPGELASIRRWIAPRSGEVSISGYVEHLTADGDGVEFAVVVDNERHLLRQDVHAKRYELEPIKLTVASGMTVDFVVDSKGGEAHDNCRAGWTLRYAESNEQYDSSRQFRGPLPPSIDPLAQLAQALILSNEFAFID